jgi:hypothetical protein
MTHGVASSLVFGPTPELLAAQRFCQVIEVLLLWRRSRRHASS